MASQSPNKAAGWRYEFEKSIQEFYNHKDPIYISIDPPKYPKWSSQAFPVSPAPDPLDGPETRKPIGTRDPDKFLKEQQDKLWKEMMG